MVFKPFTTLARQSIAKHLVNGYTQSLVAASQSSYASATLKFGQTNAPAKVHHAFGGAHSGRAAPGKEGGISDVVNPFHAAQSQLDEKEERKYLFSKKILWSKAQHQQQQKQLLGNPPEPIAENASKTRTDSFASSVGDAEVLEEVRDAAAAVEAVSENAVEEDAVNVAEPAKEEDSQPALLISEESLLPEPSEQTKAFNSHIESLQQEGRWEEITVLFDHMVGQGMQPSTVTYNILLDSIVRLRPNSASQVTDVFSKMLRQELIPTTVTYSILINFMATRALQSASIAASARRNSAEFGIALKSRGDVLKEIRAEEALSYALQLFYDSTEVKAQRVFPEPVYKVLIEACSQEGRTEDMLNVSEHMETHGMSIPPESVKALISGFGRKGDIRSAIVAYNEWHQTEAAQDPTNIELRYQIYTDLIAAYMQADDAPGALAFLEKVVEVSQEPERLEWLKQAVVRGFAIEGDIDSAQNWLNRLDLTLTSPTFLAKLASETAQHGHLTFAQHLTTYLDTPAMSLEADTETVTQSLSEYQMSKLSLAIKTDNLEQARQAWGDLSKSSSGPSVEGMIGYVLFLFDHKCIHEAVVVLRHFSISYLERPDSTTPLLPLEIMIGNVKRETLKEAFEYAICDTYARGILSPSIALDMAMLCTDSCHLLNAEASRMILNLFDEMRIKGLTLGQLQLLAKLQLDVLKECRETGAPVTQDVYHFSLLFNEVQGRGVLFNSPLGEMIGHGSALLKAVNPNFEAAWQQYVHEQCFPTPTGPAMSPVDASRRLSTSDVETLPDENFDPYRHKVDNMNSNTIDSLLERRHTKVPDLRRVYRNVRRSGRTLRMATLAKLVSFVSRGGLHEDFIEEVLRNARTDMPLVYESVISRNGWSSLLDAMLGAHLALGNRSKVHALHDELLRMGSAPSANTFGLYVVHLKGALQTYDEATEAVSIFERALKEHVIPTPFLYNAVIGKLAKARRVDDCLSFFASMRISGVKPTSVTYGTMINALTRVGDEKFAEELFQEMESMPNYKPRPAPYNSLIQFFTTTKRDRSKVLEYYELMKSRGIAPTGHTYKLLIDAYATLEKPDLAAAESILSEIVAAQLPIESCHHAALIHAKGCVLHKVDDAVAHFKSVIDGHAGNIVPDSTLYQALLESLVANHRVADTTYWVTDMQKRGIMMTPYIANTLIHGWATEKQIEKSREIYESLGHGHGRVRREPSTYEAMTRAYLAVEDRANAKKVADEMVSRGYPNAVTARVLDLVTVGLKEGL